MTNIEAIELENLLMQGINKFSDNDEALARIVCCATTLLSDLNKSNEIPALKADIRRIIGASHDK